MRETGAVRRGCLTVGLALTVALGTTATAGAASAPTATTGGATNVTYQAAILTGSVNPRGAATSYFFQYGPTPSYTNTTAVAATGSGTHAVAVAAPVSGLASGTRYHFRLVAISALGTATGGDGTFTTARVPLSLAISALPSPTPFGGPVTIAGTLSGTGNGNREVILQANPFPYTAGLQSVGNPELTTANGSFAFTVPGLYLNTQFRVISTGKPVVVSPVVFANVSLTVSARVRRLHSRRGLRLRFSGLVAPKQAGARVGVQVLTTRGWKGVAGTIAHGNSTYAANARVGRGGFFRVVAIPTNQGAYVTGYSTAMLVHRR